MISLALILSTLLSQEAADDKTMAFARVDASSEQHLVFLQELIRTGERRFASRPKGPWPRNARPIVVRRKLPWRRWWRRE